MAEGRGRVMRWLRRRGTRLGAAAAAALAASSLLVTGCAAGTMATTAGATTTTAITTTTARTSTTSPEEIDGALVASDGRHIVVPYTGGGCVVGARLTAAEARSRVTLVLRQVLSGATVCPADLIVGLTVAVTLRHPLWGRSLVDGYTGRTIHYFDGRKLLRVTYLPPGYRFSAYTLFAPPPFSAWEREFTVPGQATAPVDIEQVPGNVAAGPSWPVAARVRVGGRLAALEVLTSNGQVYGRTITWRAGGYSFAVYTVQVQGGQRLLSAAQLTRIANGLRA
jgi:hypothetical protein